jgi:hypothetical protein
MSFFMREPAMFVMTEEHVVLVLVISLLVAECYHKDNLFESVTGLGSSSISRLPFNQMSGNSVI